MPVLRVHRERKLFHDKSPVGDVPAKIRSDAGVQSGALSTMHESCHNTFPSVSGMTTMPIFDPDAIIKAKKLRHRTNNENCWCNPDLMQPCPEENCYKRAKANPNCWRCGGTGLVPEFDPDEPTLIIHKDL